MNNETARIYQVTRLTTSQLDSLYRQELLSGVVERPSAIKQKFHLTDTGDVPEASAAALQKIVMALFDRTRAQFRAKHVGCCFLDLNGNYTRPDDTFPPSLGPGNSEIIITHTVDGIILHEIDIGKISIHTNTKHNGYAREAVM